MDRRRFLKYAATTTIVAGASALGLDAFLTPRPASQTQTNINRTMRKFDLPPVANFSYTAPKYLNATDQQTIQFTNLSTDPDSDPLTYKWLVDNQLASTDKDYSTKLPVGQHIVELETSDAQINSTTAQTVTVEPDQLYPSKSLQLKYKGMIYAAARVSPELNSTPSVIPDHQKINEQLDTIHDELGCNAVRISAGADYEDNLIDACTIASQKGFDRVYALSKYMHFTVDEIAEKLKTLAPRITTLREMSDKIVWVIGNEFTYCVKGLIPGDTFQEQQAWIKQHHDGYVEAQQTNIPKVFEQILPIIRKNYDYPVAYDAEKNEIDLVPWADPIFESVCWNAYLQPAYGQDENFLISKFSQLRRFQKPVIASEFGCAAWTGAGQASMSVLFNNQPYDEEEQATSIDRHCKAFNKAAIDGAYLYIYNEEWDKGFGLYNGMKRKKGFYMYKSYQRNAES